MAMGLVPAGNAACRARPGSAGLGGGSGRPAAPLCPPYGNLCRDARLRRPETWAASWHRSTSSASSPTRSLSSRPTMAAPTRGTLRRLAFQPALCRAAGLPVELDLEREAWVGTGRGSAVYPTGWAQVSNTPFPSYKTYTGGGGRRVSFVVSWPEKLRIAGQSAASSAMSSTR